MLPLKRPSPEGFQIKFANHFPTCKIASTINESSKTVGPEERQKKMVLEPFVYFPFNHLTRLLDWASFIAFRRREGFRLCNRIESNLL